MRREDISKDLFSNQKLIQSRVKRESLLQHSGEHLGDGKTLPCMYSSSIRRSLYVTGRSVKEHWGRLLFLILLFKGASTPKCHFLHTLLGLWTNHYCTRAQITRSSIMVRNLKCPNTIPCHGKSNRHSVSYLHGSFFFSVERGLTTSTVDVSGACRHVMWNGVFMFLLQEGIMGSPCKYKATHTQRES